MPIQGNMDPMPRRRSALYLAIACCTCQLAAIYTLWQYGLSVV